MNCNYSFIHLTVVNSKMFRRLLSSAGINLSNRCTTCHPAVRFSRFSPLTAPENASAAQSRSSRQENKDIIPEYVNNRNPRNLEKLKIGEKPMGFNMDKPGKSFWNKVTLELSEKHVTAKVKHYTGVVPVSASTRESCIKNQLYSTRDLAAVETIAKILAHRALEAGIHELHCSFDELEMQKDRVKMFVKTLEDNGMVLSEPDQIPERERRELHFPTLSEKPWDIEDELEEQMVQRVLAKTNKL